MLSFVVNYPSVGTTTDPTGGLADLVVSTPTANVPNPLCCNVIGHLCENCQRLKLNYYRVSDAADIAAMSPPTINFAEEAKRRKVRKAEIVDNAKTVDFADLPSYLRPPPMW
jgi:hypothetical protein